MDMSLQSMLGENSKVAGERETFWNLDNFKEKMLALKFARSIENIFSVYIDDPINQLYTNYFLEVYTEQCVSILLSTDPYSDSVFNGIPGECLLPSRYWVFPGGFFKKPEYKFLLARMRGEKLARPEKLILPSKILSGISPDYMPVITNQGLFEFQQATPCLNLQFVDVRKLRSLGSLPPIKMNDLVHSMSEKIEKLVNLGC